MMQLQDLLDTKQASVYTGLAPQTLRNLVAKKAIPFHRISRKRVVYARAEVDVWMNQRGATQGWVRDCLGVATFLTEMQKDVTRLPAGSDIELERAYFSAQGHLVQARMARERILRGNTETVTFLMALDRMLTEIISSPQPKHELRVAIDRLHADFPAVRQIHGAHRMELVLRDLQPAGGRSKAHKKRRDLVEGR